MTKIKRLDGFSLVEISIVLLIVGIIAGATFKGRDMIMSARIKSVVNDVQMLQLAYENYVSSYGSLPGDDKEANTRFKNAENGDGDGKFSEGDAKKVFSHLFFAGLIESKDFKVPKIGGAYEVIAENNALKLKLSASFATKQAISFVAKCKEVLGSTDMIESNPAQINSDSETYTFKITIG
ncbi:hypothetical protein FACS1894113_4510 [Alphaproteobacteria bacterium]|nr:hypothetical protein FACS1894113_4510 [Alphaproteobacteria bacterium]